MAAPAPGPAAAPAYVPPPPAATGGGGSGKGLIIGLGGLALLIGIVIVVVAVKSMKKDDGGDQPLTNPFESSSGATNIAPIDTGAGTTTPDWWGGGCGGPPTTPPTTTAKPPTTPTKPTSTGTGTKPPVSNTAACDQCISLAQSGAIQAAAGAYHKCSDAGKKAQCSMRARRSAQGAVNSAALNGNCAQAKAIAAAAAGMGAGSPNVPPKCK
jgi:hypothetical protein